MGRTESGGYPLTWTVRKPSTNVVRFLHSPLGPPPILFFLPTFPFGSLSGEASGKFIPYLACIRPPSGVQRLILGVVIFTYKIKIPYFEVKVGFCTYFPYFTQELTQKSRGTNPGYYLYLKNCLILPWISCKPVLRP